MRILRLVGQSKARQDHLPPRSRDFPRLAACLILSLLTLLYGAAGGAPMAAQASPELGQTALPPTSAGQNQPDQSPPPLPSDCTLLAPPGEDPPEACVYGYVLLDGVPAYGAAVALHSGAATVNVVTGNGPASPDPYFAAALTTPPLDASLGELVKVEATHGVESNTLTFTVVEDGQQVDISLSSACGPTTVPGGLLTSDAIWTPECGPYTITGNLLVMDGTTLTVLPGTTVRFDPTVALQVEGRLDAQGAANAMVVFTASSTPAPGAWGYILLREPALVGGHDLAYALIEYGGGLSVADNGALRVENAWPNLHDITVRHSAADGVHFFGGGGGSISYANIHDNAGWGLYVNSGSLSATDSALHIHHNAGGGIYVNGAGPMWLSGSVIRENTGCGIDARGSAVDLYVSVCLIQGNSAGSHGAGLYIYRATLDLSDSWILGNEATGGHDGGGLYCSSNSTCLIEHNIIGGNSAGDEGGGIYVYSGTLHEIQHNVFASNSAADSGGGLSFKGGTAGLPVAYNAFLGNTAAVNGAAIYVTRDISITDNTILHNTSGSDLGAIYADNHPVLNLNNIYSNSDYDLFNDNPQGEADLNAELNWWGTTDAGLIRATIWDWFFDGNLALVDWDPWLASHSLAAPISPPLGLSASMGGNEISLSWSPNPEGDLAGYQVYYDTSPGFPYAGTGALEGDSPVDAGSATSFTLTGLPKGHTYYLAVTAYDTTADGVRDQTEGHESWFYGEASVEIPGDLQADFTGTPTAGPAPLEVSFSNLSSGIYTTCEWTFGDGGTSSSCEDPGHTYMASGSYTVTLTVSGSEGSDSLTRPDYVTVYEPVEAQFTGSPTSGVAPLLVTFTNGSSGDYTTCAWTFGDGGTSSSCGNPTHTYDTAGLYPVSLTVTGPGGTDTLTRSGYITVYEPVDAQFTGNPTSGVAPLLVTFTNGSSGDYTTCAWTFGDGGTSSSCGDPTHTYDTPGSYPVSLTLNGPGGSDTLTRPGYITVLPAHTVYLPLIMH